MKKRITFIALCFIAIAVTAQTAHIKVSYVAHHPNLTDGKTDLTNKYILLANITESKFYSPITEYIDSLSSTPEGKTKLTEISRAALNADNLDGIPKPDGTIYVIKSFANNKLKYYDTAGLEKFTYEELITPWKWEICDSTNVILGYECIMAITAGFSGYILIDLHIKRRKFLYKTVPGSSMDFLA